MNTRKKGISLTKVPRNIDPTKKQNVACAMRPDLCFKSGCKICQKGFSKSHYGIINRQRTCSIYKDTFQQKNNQHKKEIFNTVKTKYISQETKLLKQQNGSNGNNNLSYKQFYFVYPDGTQIKFPEKDNVLTNINLKFKKYQIQISNHVVYLKALKCVDKLFLGGSQAIVKHPILDINFKEDPNRQKQVYWLFEGNNNSFQMYDKQSQQTIQKQFQNNVYQGKSKLDIYLVINQRSYLVDIIEKKQYFQDRQSIPRQIKRQEI